MRAVTWIRALPLAALLLLTNALAAPARAGGLPEPVRATLPNGLSVLVVPTSRLPLVDFRLVVRAGSVNDPAGREGVARLTAELLTQGAGKRTAKQLADDIEFVGGSLNASAGAEQLVVSGEVLKKDLALGLELFRDVIVLPWVAEHFSVTRDAGERAILQMVHTYTADGLIATSTETDEGTGPGEASAAGLGVAFTGSRLVHSYRSWTTS